MVYLEWELTVRAALSVACERLAGGERCVAADAVGFRRAQRGARCDARRAAPCLL